MAAIPNVLECNCVTGDYSMLKHTDRIFDAGRSEGVDITAAGM